MSYNPADYEEISVKFADSSGQSKTSSFRVSAGESQSNVELLIGAMQNQSNASVVGYTRHKPMVNASPSAAVPFNGAVNPLNLLSTALDLDFNCGPNKSKTSTSILAPSNVNLIPGSYDKLRLDPASSSFTTLQSTAVAAMVNTGGDSVVTLQQTQVQTRKSRLLQAPAL